MKIYEVRETGGEFEDFFDKRVVAYTTKEAAIKECERLMQLNAIAQDQRECCATCPLAYENWDTKEGFEHDKEKYEYYAPCVRMATVGYEAGSWGGVYYTTCWQGYRDDIQYYVEEVEVVEELV